MHQIEKKQRYVPDPLEIALQSEYFGNSYKTEFLEEFKTDMLSSTLGSLHGSNDVNFDYLVEKGVFLPSSGFYGSTSTLGAYGDGGEDFGEDTLAEEFFWGDSDDSLYEEDSDESED